MKDEPLRVGVNATSLLSPLTGIGNYTYFLCRALEARGDCEVHYFYGYRWSNVLRARFSPAVAAARGVVRYVAPLLRPVARAIQQAAFSAGARERELDVYHDPNFIPFRFAGPVVSTVHDLSVSRFPETHPADRRRFMEKHLARAVANSDQIVTVSRFVRDEVIGDFPDARERVRAVHNGVAEAFRPVPAAERQSTLDEIGLRDGRYFLCVGTIEPRKNLARVAEAYARLPADIQADYPLVVVGGRGWKVAESMAGFRELRKKGRLVLTGYLETDRLVALYSGACAFVYPSLYEGFGLPVIEAMACGTPVITSNRSSLPEVAGDAARIVDPLDVAEITNSMAALCRDPSERERLVLIGRERAAGFSWSRCAEETMAVYREAIACR